MRKQIPIASQILIKPFFGHVQPSMPILKNNTSFYENLEGILLIITWSHHPLEKIWTPKSKLMQGLGAINPQSVVSVEDLYYFGNSPPGKKGANE
jgi:hypothetical protein